MELIKPLKIGSLKLKNNLLTAPLAGISESVFRQLMLAHGAGLVYSEMISAAALSRRDKKTFKMLRTSKQEYPLAVQLFGNKPSEFSVAAKIVTAEVSADIIDINMGCPVKKVVASGSGAALMKDLALAKEIIRAVVSATNLPVTVKFRLGWSAETVNFLELGKICQEEGAAAVTLHPRTRGQFFLGRADRSKIKELKEALRIPVIGNGDICSLRGANVVLAETGCDGIMLGRGLMGNPWLLNSILEQRERIIAPAEKIKMYLEHTKRYLAFYPEREAVKVLCEMRKFAHRYINGFAGAAELRRQINVIKEPAELEELLAASFNDNSALFR